MVDDINVFIFIYTIFYHEYDYENYSGNALFEVEAFNDFKIFYLKNYNFNSL